MVLPDLVAIFVDPLDALGLPYMITGGVASVIYGDPRFTRHIDVVLQLKASQAERFTSAFDLDDFYVPPVDVIAEEADRARHGHFNVIHRESGLRADVYLLSDDALHAWGFQRRRRMALGERSVSVAPPEYVILRKLEYYAQSSSERHLRDIALMLRISPEMIDAEVIADLADDLGLTDEWRMARDFEPRP